ncbi:winged helix-turn-helix domain-containing protein [Methanosarcina sp. KYL-1]|uniref:winged helix-turn-helix domain-containing protein n=1 Tax=Methanosarcina sp. KYL-1 TaxID=2602068 RepID=UPI0021012B77|nr:helix-turn-helix domain-containing protein [Methanosarcina sp. KYL-1]
MKNNDKGRNCLQAPETPEHPEIAEIQAIKAKLSEMHSDIKKVMEYSNRLHLESALASSRTEYSNILLGHLLEDIETGLDRSMVKKCPEKENCRAAFTGLLQKNAGMIKEKHVDEAAISKTGKKIEEMRQKAPYGKCDRCFSEVSTLFLKQVSLMRSMRIYAVNQEQKEDISALETVPVVNEILEPVANSQRLEILKAVAFEARSFSGFSELTGLRGGNLLFHLQKLLDSELIMQQHERGDYMITEKGFKILKGLNEIYSALQAPGALAKHAGKTEPVVSAVPTETPASVGNE